MSSENNNDHKPMEEYIQSNPNSTKKDITIKKSTYNYLIIGVFVAIGFVAFFGGFLFSNSSVSDDYVTKSDMEEIISQIDSKLDKIQQQPVPTRQPTQPAPSIIAVSLDDDPAKGSPDAPVTIVEFSDFQCPFCSRFFEQTLPQLEENYIDTGKVKLVFKDFPLDNLHPNARPAHIAAECADEQGMFWQYHDVLFENQAQWNRLSSVDLKLQFSEYATILGLESSSFDSCLASQDIADEVNGDYLQASSYGATGTPTFFIGNEKDGFIKLVGAQPYVTFQTAIDSQLG